MNRALDLLHVTFFFAGRKHARAMFPQSESSSSPSETADVSYGGYVAAAAAATQMEANGAVAPRMEGNGRLVRSSGRAGRTTGAGGRGRLTRIERGARVQFPAAGSRSAAGEGRRVGDGKYERWGRNKRRGPIGPEGGAPPDDKKNWWTFGSEARSGNENDGENDDERLLSYPERRGEAS